MLFVVAYDRPKMALLTFESFASAATGEAGRLKLQLEQRYANREDVEVGLFESASEAVLRRTHSRYFFNIEALAANVADNA